MGIVVLLIVVLAIVLPLIFKGEIIEIAKKEINRNVKAKVDFADMNLSLFRSFPDFSLRISDLTVAGVEEFEGDTLADVGSVMVTIDLISVFKGNYEVKKIAIDAPDIYVIVREDGIANYDIALPSEETDTIAVEEEEGEPFVLRLNQLTVSDGRLIYDDRSLAMHLLASGLDHELSGDLSAERTQLETSTSIGTLTLSYDGVEYLTNATVVYKAGLDADLANETYTLMDNALEVNALMLNFDGTVGLDGEKTNIDLTFNTPQTDFKSILSLVPAFYTRDFESVQTSGSLTFDGEVKGYYAEERLPGFNVNIRVEDAEVKYPDLPGSIREINIVSEIRNQGGDADNTVVDISRFDFRMLDNPFHAQMLLKTPVSDPDIQAEAKGRIDLSAVEKVYPLGNEEALKGMITADISIDGKMSDIENENYQQFKAEGSLEMSDIRYTSSYLGKPVKIPAGRFDFSPSHLELTNLKLMIGSSDMSLEGQVRNWLPYVLSDGTISGNLSLNSDFFSVSEIMPEEMEENAPETAESDTVSYAVVEIPGNVDFRADASIDRLIYDSIEMKNVKGSIAVTDKKLLLENLSMNVLDGSMGLQGEYNTREPSKPLVDMNLDINELDIQQAYNTFAIMSKYLPLAEKTTGSFSSDFSFTSTLDKEMMPVYETMNGSGSIRTSRIEIKDVNTLDRIADAVKFDKIRSMVIDKIMFSFTVEDGKVIVEPFDFNFENINGELSGWTAIDQSISYDLDLKVPRKEFGSAANSALSNMVAEANELGADFSLGETVALGIVIGGTLSDPVIKTELQETGKKVVEEVKEKIKEKFEEKKEEITKDVKEEAQKILDDANARADQIIAEAEKQAENIRNNAQQAADNLIKEADQKAADIEKEGKKKGMLAEVAAKESAKKIRSEARAQADNLIKEADKKANELVQKAKNEAAEIRKKAQEEADGLTNK